MHPSLGRLPARIEAGSTARATEAVDRQITEVYPDTAEAEKARKFLASARSNR